MDDSSLRFNPLNPTLYSLLRQRFGKVVPANEGIAMCGAPRMAAATSVYGGTSFGPAYDSGLSPFGQQRRRRISNVLTWGEYYRVSCPFCRETRQRLWINHLYGTKDDVGIPQHWLAHCYNEKCTTDPAVRALLEFHIFGIGQHPQLQIMQGENVSAVLSETRPPGPIAAFHELFPEHPVRRYLLERRYDLAYLSSQYGVGMCVDSTEFPAMRGRIYIPIVMHGQLVGWQGRYPDELDWKATGIPKYYGRPGMAKGRMLYNLDVAKQWPFVVVVEGVPSVWRLGGPAVALLGKTLTGPQRILLNYWAGKPIIIMLDPDAADNSEGIVRELKQTAASPVVEIRLPGDYDPGDYEHEVGVAMIRNAARLQGVMLPEW